MSTARRTTAAISVAVSLALIVTACAEQATEPVEEPSEPGLERIQAWAIVERHQVKQRVDATRASRWLTTPGNEDRSAEDARAALGIVESPAGPAVEAALQIVNANPTDDLGFLALRFAFYELRSLPETERQQYEDAVYEAIEEHYIHDPRVDGLILGLVRFGGDRGADLVDTIVADSTRRELRARGAYWSAAERRTEVDDLSLSPQERAEIRDEVLRMARRVAEEYSDVEVFRGQTGGEAIAPVLFSLENLAVGNIVPDVTAERIGGGEESLRDYRGQVVLLDFWATWCVPCIVAVPKKVALQERLADNGFTVITISTDQNPELVEAFMERRMELPFVNWFVGAQSQLYQDWAIPSLPTYYLVDREGVIRGRSQTLDMLIEPILDATGADEQVRAEFLTELDSLDGS